MTKISNLLGVVLAGGQSRRMGQDKLFVELGGELLIRRAVKRLKQQIEHVTIVGPKEKTLLSKLGASHIEDNHEGFQGPLAGIFAGLSNAEVHGFEGIVTIAADTPFFPDNFVKRIIEPRSIYFPQEEPVTIARSPDGLHPVFGSWSVSAVPKVLKSLDNNVRKVMAAADDVGWEAVDFEVSGIDPFFNINTPEDLKRAEQEVAK